jgi:predicted enzyme related to lactoylglutathione lyase
VDVVPANTSTKGTDMPPTAPLGSPCWIDLTTSDKAASTHFYASLFGWTIDDPGPDYGGYLNFLRDGVRVGGCMDAQPGMPDVWSVYLSSVDAKGTVDAVEAAGGSVIVPAMDVMDLGRMAFVVDTGGAAIGVWEPGEHRGFGVLHEPGAPCWFELHTRAHDASVRFYREAFGWETYAVSDTPEFRYTTLGEGECQLAGIMDATAWLPDGVPAHWSVYFRVDDADATLARVVELGGAVVMPAEDTPYGRIATVADPVGAIFKLNGPVTS